MMFKRDIYDTNRPDNLTLITLETLRKETDELGRVLKCPVSIQGDAMYYDHVKETKLQIGVWIGAEGEWYRFEDAASLWDFIDYKRKTHNLLFKKF